MLICLAYTYCSLLHISVFVQQIIPNIPIFHLLISFRKVGSWKGSSVRGPQSSLAPLLYPAPDAAYLDLTGQRLKVAVVDNWPFFGLIERPNGTWEPSFGIDYSVLDTLSKRMNFTYAIIYRKSSVYKNISWEFGRESFICSYT